MTLLQNKKFHYYKWSSFNYNFFYENLDYLYLGSKQDKRLPATDVYTHMYSYYRGEYSIFFYKKMWLNYIKKLNLLKKLYSDPANNFFFITNKIEQVKFLSGQANKASARVLFIESAGQFSDKLFNKDSKYFFEKAAALGAANSATYNYASRDSNIFFSISNSAKDSTYFKFLTEISDVDFLTISTADADSIFLSKFIPLFGNNDNSKSWHFFFNIFKISAVRRDALSPYNWTNFKGGARTAITFNKVSNFYNTPAKYSHSFYVSSKRLSTRSLRAFCLVNLKKASYENVYSALGKKFYLPKGSFHYFKYKI